jgi:hypothetical protein
VLTISQPVALVTVTPHIVTGRIPGQQQFTAVATDANGIVIPGQTLAWTSTNRSVATIDPSTGLAVATGPVSSNAAWRYEVLSTGVGDAGIVATAVGVPVASGQATFTTVAGGFVYSTYRAPYSTKSPFRNLRPKPEEFRYDESRLASMSRRCLSENGAEAWLWWTPFTDRRFYQCYSSGQYENLVRRWTPFGYTTYFWPNLVLLYGRHCGEGFPGTSGVFLARAEMGNYQPKDPIDALCMDHDRAEETHDITWWTKEATCIVRYGIDAETLHENGVLIARGSSRWNAFFPKWPEMSVARTYYGNASQGFVACDQITYNQFLSDRGLAAP